MSTGRSWRGAYLLACWLAGLAGWELLATGPFSSDSDNLDGLLNVTDESFS